MDLLPEKSETEVANEAASFFNKISREFKPLSPEDIPSSFERVLPKLSVQQVAQRLRDQKKPGSVVHGDIFPKLVNPCADSLAVPLTSIFNEVVKSLHWPEAWKTEYVTLIPKKGKPNGLADLRNISCTAFFSKVLETFVLQWAMDEVTLKPNQYGGVKGCSTSHMLLEIWQQICSNLEDYRSSTVLTAIDYSKAFNRLSFQKCLESFKKKGASSSVIRLLGAFLTGRTMKVRAGSSWSMPLRVDGGCPQGSILGVFLFNVTTDDLEDEFTSFDRQNLAEAEIPANHVEILPQARNVPSYLEVPRLEEKSGTQVLVQKPTIIVKYVDDNIICEKVNFGRVPILQVGGALVKRRKALSSQNAFRTIVRNAKYKGMLVNNDKTCVLCVSDSLSHSRETFITDEEGNEIRSESSLKVLGFSFSTKPTVQAQIDSIIKKFRQRYWTLRHLKKLGFSEKELVLVYKTNILPIADYADVIYHSLMTDEQDEALENAQNSALKCIFNPRLSARALREKSGLSTLRKRRVEHCDKFSRKCIASPRFCYLFPLKESRRNTRSNEKYVEEFARCDRLKNSPLFFMRRRMNGKEGKSYGERNRIFREA